MTLTVTLPDGNALELPDGATGADAAAAIGPGLARAALAVEVSHPEAGEGPELRDLSRPLPDGASLAIVTKKDGEKALELIRHDAAHVLAEAVLELYGGVKISIGPPIADGFYYDFEFPEGVTISEADFPQIEERMREHVKAAEPFERRDVSPAEARERFAAEAQDYKVELIDDLVAQRRPPTTAAERLAVHERPVHRPLSRAARAEHQVGRRVQAAVGRRRLLARGLRPHDAHAHLRHGVLLQGRTGRAPGAHRAGQGARPPQAGARARAVHVLRAVARGARSGSRPGWRSGTR